MSHKDDYFDGDTHDLLLYKIAQRDKVIDECYGALEDIESCMQGVIEGDYTPDGLTLQPVRLALAAIEQLGKEKS